MSQPGVKGQLKFLGSESLDFLESAPILSWDTSDKTSTSLHPGFHICKVGLIVTVS